MRAWTCIATPQAPARAGASQADGDRRTPGHRRQYNYTAPATTLNDENIIVIGDLEESDTAAEDRQREIAGCPVAEIDRIITELSEPITA
jgi:hypothetical protein